MEHFVALGTNIIWLSPIFKSPMADFGYDISDFIAIDPIFGTMQDFTQLTAKAKSLGEFKVQVYLSWNYFYFKLHIYFCKDWKLCWIWCRITAAMNTTGLLNQSIELHHTPIIMSGAMEARMFHQLIG